MAFIPAAERYNLMPTIDRWVIETAFGDPAQRQSRTRRGRVAKLSRSICPARRWRTTSFLDFVRAQFARFAIPYSLICFEITETTAVTSLSKAADFIAALRALGCRFALDDFGVGMSSFTYLKHLPVDFLKIDGSFVRNMLDDPVDHALVETIHRIGHVLGMQTIAEAVESDAILEALPRDRRRVRARVRHRLPGRVRPAPATAPGRAARRGGVRGTRAPPDSRRDAPPRGRAAAGTSGVARRRIQSTQENARISPDSSR